MPKKLEKTGAMMCSITLRRLIERMDISLKDFSKECGFSPSTLSFYLTGKRETTPLNRRRILNRLKKIYSNVTWDDLFYFDENTNINREEKLNEDK